MPSAILMKLVFYLLGIAVIVVLRSLFAWYRKAVIELAEVPAVARRRSKGTMGQLRDLLLLVALIAVIMHAAAPAWMSWSELPMCTPMRWLAAGCAGLGLALFAWAIRALWRSGRKEGKRVTLVTSGPFAYVRHPMYLAVLITLVSLTIMTANWIVLVMSAAFLGGLFTSRLRREEETLRSRFGETYAAYAMATPALLPRWRRPRSRHD